MVRLFFLVLLLVAAPTAAQPASPPPPPPTNRMLLESLIQKCLPPDIAGSVVISADGVPSFIVDAVRRDLLAAGATIWTAEVPGAAEASRLDLGGWTGNVYLAGRGGVLDRTVVLSADVRWTQPNGNLVYVDACQRSTRDRVVRRLLPYVEDPLIPETIANRPPPSRLRRWSEPLIAGGAVVVGVLLLFSVRS